MNRKNAWLKYPEGEKRRQVMDFAEQYRQFLTTCKTERETTTWVCAEAEKHGFVNLEKLIADGAKLKAGDKVYANNRGKGVVLFVIGQDPIASGMNMLGAHIDSPRMDLKQNPVYEKDDLAYLDTHYYGGIKKYQWVALPLALHGVICKKDGTTVTVNIGDKPGDPVVGISDLLIHLAGKQMTKTLAEGIEGENLDVLVGNIPLSEDEKTSVKQNVLSILMDTYGVEEEDFYSAEIEVVPAGEARDFGLDRSMIMGYGHDDRVCAFPSYKAIEAMEKPQKTSVCILVDKEEIGSVGSSGMQSYFFENAVADVMDLAGEYSPITLRRALSNSVMLSSDVSVGYDPLYCAVMDPANTAYLGKGLVINKYTGARGKSGANDASAEFLARVRKSFDDAEVSWQTSEIGRVDAGGGGTIAFIMGNKCINVVDAGVPVLSMHAPWEIISKVDVYEALLGYEAFLTNC